jgi:hypothetical protein
MGRPHGGCLRLLRCLKTIGQPRSSSRKRRDDDGEMRMSIENICIGPIPFKPTANQNRRLLCSYIACFLAQNPISAVLSYRYSSRPIIPSSSISVFHDFKNHYCWRLLNQSEALVAVPKSSTPPLHTHFSCSRPTSYCAASW